jgi:two-component system NtrC family sensor kinase
MCEITTLKTPAIENDSSPQLPGVSDSGLEKMQEELEKIEEFLAQIKDSDLTEASDETLRQLLEISNAMNSNLNLDKLLTYVMDQVIEMTKAEYGYLIFLDEKGELEFKVAHNLAKEEIESAEFEISRSVIREVKEKGQTVFLADASQEENFKNQYSIMDLKLKSIMCVPLKVKAKLFGLLYLENRTVAGMFTKEQLGILEIFSNQAATAIENARLFELTDEKLQKKVKELSAINSIISTVNKSLNLDETLTDTLRIITQLFKADFGGIWTFEAQNLILKAWHGFSDNSLRDYQKVRLEDKRIQNIFHSPHPLIVNEPEGEKNGIVSEAGKKEGMQSYLATPLELKNNFIGIIFLGSEELEHFKSEDGELFSAIAGQISVGIENAQLYLREENKSHRLNLINQISLKTTSILDLDRLLDELLRLIYQELGFYSVNLALKENEHLKIRSIHPGCLPELKPVLLPFDSFRESIVSWVAKNNQALMVPDVSQDPRYFFIEFLKETKSELAVPLEIQGKVLGVLDVQSNKLDGFDQDDLQLIQSIANQAAVAIENARLYQDSERKVKELSVLNQVAQAISSTLDLDVLLEEIYEQLTQVINSSGYYVTLHDETAQLLHFEILIDEEKRFPKTTVPVGDGAVSYVIRTKKPLLMNDVEKYMEALGLKVQIVGTNKLSQSWMGVPMISGEKVLGVLAVSSYEKNAFSQNDLGLLTNITNQAALAVMNAQFFQQILKGKKEWEHTFDSITDLICLLDENFAIVRANKIVAEKLGLGLDEVIGKKCYEIFHKYDSVCPNCPHKRAWECKKPATYERKSSISDEIFSVSTFPRFDQEGKFIGAVHVTKDVTAQKRLREQLLQSEKMGAVGQLVSGVAHELNNPLAGVMGYVQLLLMRSDLDEKTVTSLNKILKESDRAKNIVLNLLTFARKHKPEKKYVNINTILEQTLELRQYDLRVTNTEVVKELSTDIPNTMADFYQLQQVFLNIINNAHQAMMEDQGKGALTIRTMKVGDFISISIADTGPGIPKENLTKIFEPFFTTKEVGRGTGLGLSISYGIIEEHGGKINCFSEIGKGANFVIEIPIIKDFSSPNLSESQRIEIQQKGAKGKNILIIDDEQSILDVLTNLFEAESHKVENAPNGRIGFEKMKTNDYDLVITDIKMPGYDGRKLYSEIEKLNPAKAQKIIFTTGDTANQDTQIFLEKTKAICIPKPFDLKEVKNTVERFFSQ